VFELAIFEIGDWQPPNVLLAMWHHVSHVPMELST